MDTFPSSPQDLNTWCQSLISAQQKSWAFQPHPSHFADKLAQDFSLSPLASQVASLRIPNLQDAHAFLTPSLRTHLPEPLSLKDMDKAVSRTITAIRNQESIALIADYDVDGSTSAAILLFYLRALGITVATYVPERLSEGYGPNPHALQHLHENHKPSLLFTLDCGTSASSLSHASQYNMDTIILDHHQPPDTLPHHHALVNPRRLDDSSNLEDLAAVGVVFFFLVALNRELRLQNFFSPSLPEPSLLPTLDLVALGTVCDMVPLTLTNRLLVSQGLKIMRNSRHCGLRALLLAAHIKRYPLAKDLGFSIGPLINAASRMGKSHLALETLSCQDPEKAQELAHILVTLNHQRKKKEYDNLHIALQDLTLENHNLPFTHIASPHLHIGVAGLLASHLVKRYQKPAFVTAINTQNNTAKGSARSIEGFNIGSCLHAAQQDTILEKAGGHAMAGGYSLSPSHTEKFSQFLSSYCSLHPPSSSQPHILFENILHDFSLKTLSKISPQLLPLEPFGINNHEPILLIPNIHIKATIFKDTLHIRCLLSSPYHSQQKLSLMAFRTLGTPLGHTLLSPPPLCHALVSLGSPSAYKNQPDIRLIDIAWHPS